MERWVIIAVGAACAAFASSLTWSQSSPLTEPVELAPGLRFGDWTDVVEIELPLGPGGLSPSLDIRHGRSAHNAGLGQGFLLGELQRIERRSVTGGVPGHTEDSLFLQNGEPLIPDRLQAVIVGRDITTYRKQTDDGSKISYDADADVWTIELDGWTWSFGVLEDAGANSVLSAPALSNVVLGDGTGQPQPLPPENGPPEPLAGACTTVIGTDHDPGCNTVRWLLTKTVDPYGNTIRYDYRSDEVPTALQSIYPG